MRRQRRVAGLRAQLPHLRVLFGERGHRAVPHRRRDGRRSTRAHRRHAHAQQRLEEHVGGAVAVRDREHRGGAAADAPSEDQPRSRCALAISSAADRVLPVPGGPRMSESRWPSAHATASICESFGTNGAAHCRALSTAMRMAAAAASAVAVRKVRRELCGKLWDGRVF